MFTSKLVVRLSPLRRATCAFQTHGDILTGRVPPVFGASCLSVKENIRKYATAANNTPPPRWIHLEPELEEALVPRKLSVSPLESWLSLRYSLPPLLESSQPQEDVELLEEKVLPPISVPVLEDETGSATPLECKNVLQIRRRKMNRHKYRKLQKRRKFVKRKVLLIRATKKQKKFEKEMTKIWSRAGLRKAPPGWTTPNIYLRHLTKTKRRTPS